MVILFSVVIIVIFLIWIVILLQDIKREFQNLANNTLKLDIWAKWLSDIRRSLSSIENDLKGNKR